MRNLTKTIAAVSLLVPASAYSLGIGDIKLHSALNQTLDAEIALLVSEGENISDLRVRLAPPEKFDEAGIPWNYFLSKMKFVPILRSDGTAIVKVSSREVLKEPFLDFLVEVTWEKGNLYREFTVLVDPPVSYTQPVIPVVQKAEQVAESRQETETREDKVVTRESLTNEMIGGSDSIQNDGKYGPIRRNESLWKVAEKTNNHKDVSIEQMMMAIYDANQQAFYGNVNSLKAGQTLDIPEKEVILKLTKKQALAAFMQQTEEWKGRRSVASADKQTSLSETETKAQLDLKAPVEGEIAETAVVVSENDVLANRVAELDKEKAVATLSEEGLALQARMAKLEQQLEMMQKMLVLKDEQIAALQQKQKTAPEVGETIVEPSQEKDEGLTEQAIEPKDKAEAETEKVDTTVEPEVITDKQQEVQAEPESESGFPAMSLVAIPVLGVLGWLFWRRRKNNEEIEAESMFASATDISLPDASEQEIQPETGVTSEPNTVDTSSFNSTPTDDSSLIGEFETSDFNSFYTEQTEVDPVLEADVYLAYGRYQQAEDLMQQAIVDQPERDECKLKLLEVFQADENKSAFEKYTTELLNAGKHNDKEFWDKVTEMGGKLNIEPGLLGENIGEKANFDLDDSDVDSTLLENENITGSGGDELKEDKPGLADEAVVETANEMDFDLSIFDEDEKDFDLETNGVKEDNGLDFDLSQFDLEDSGVKSTEEVGATKKTDSVDMDIEAIAFETGEDSTEKKGKESEEIESFDFDMEPETELENKIDLDTEMKQEKGLDEFDFHPDNLLADTDEAADDESFTPSQTKLDSISNDHDSSDSDSAGQEQDEMGLGVSDLTDEDELETKIDLAKAYIDMEDVDSAKAIAEEVLEKGNENQKQAAQAIIKQLDES